MRGSHFNIRSLRKFLEIFEKRLLATYKPLLSVSTALRPLLCILCTRCRMGHSPCYEANHYVHRTGRAKQLTPELDEVFLTAEGRVDWKFGANGANAVTTLFERLIGEPEPDFAPTGFEEQMSAAMHAGPSRRM
jgi:hypothetical protein